MVVEKNEKVSFGALKHEEHETVEAILNVGYVPMTSRNPHTGKHERVVLLPSSVLSEIDAVSVESKIELHADINQACSGFNKLQLRVLQRVLIQGQSVEKATTGLRKTSRWWQKWIADEALPKLRAKLADYNEGGKLVIR